MRCRAGVGDKKEESQNPYLTISLTQTYLDREGGEEGQHFIIHFGDFKIKWIFAILKSCRFWLIWDQVWGLSSWVRPCVCNEGSCNISRRQVSHKSVIIIQDPGPSPPSDVSNLSRLLQLEILWSVSEVLFTKHEINKWLAVLMSCIFLRFLWEIWYHLSRN